MTVSRPPLALVIFSAGNSPFRYFGAALCWWLVATGGISVFSAEAADLVVISGTTTISSGTNAYDNTLIAPNAADEATLALTGGTLTNPGGALVVGQDGTGTLNLSGGVLSAQTGTIGYSAGSVGTANISNGTLESFLTVGYSGTGTLNITGGSVTGGLNVASDYGSVGTVNILSGTASGGNIFVGQGGAGTLSLSGGSVTSLQFDIGFGNGSTGTFIMTGGTATSSVCDIGNAAGSVGTATVSGGTWTSGPIFVGLSGTGTLNVAGGSVINNADAATSFTDAFIGRFGVGEVTVSSGEWRNSGSLSVQNGTLSVTGGNVSNTDGFVGAGSHYEFGGGVGMATVSSGTWANSGWLNVGDMGGNGTVAVTGGTVTSSFCTIGLDRGGVGTVTVSSGSFASSGRMIVGNVGGTGTLSVSGGTVTNNDYLWIGGRGGAGTVTVSSGTLTDNGGVYVGIGGSGTLSVTGGTLTTAQGIIGDEAENIQGTGVATVQGGFWKVGGDLVVGNGNSFGTLEISGSGNVTVSGSLSQGNYGTITLNSGGTLQIGDGGTVGDLLLSELVDNGKLVFDRSDSSTFAGVISGTGNMTQAGAGTVTLTGNNTYSGTTTVASGGLTVNGAIGSGNVTVASGAMLSGTGTIGGTATIHGGHTLGDPVGTQTINGDLAYSIEQGKVSGPSVYWNLLANASTDPTQFGNVQLTGSLGFASTTAFELAFNGLGSSVDWSNSFWATDEQWTVYSVGGSVANFARLTLKSSDWLDGNGNAFSVYLTGGSFWLTQVGHNVVLNYSRSSASAVPEIDPAAGSSALALVAGVLAMIEQRRRRCCAAARAG
ncbi:MAG: autotransporter-associated beta strand repeat-containing protein [Planctomycetota bacterium]